MKALTALAVLSVLLLYVWERVDVVQVGYHIEQLKSKKVALERERDELRLKVSTLSSPDRIAKAATEKLGMVPPQQGQVRLVRLMPDVPTKAVTVAMELKLAKHDIVRMVP
ncbi:MAG: cell division protein FtsL [Nitrospirales bacterium]|nr:cell division protein FtsL [Nitrospirales bacterium]